MAPSATAPEDQNHALALASLQREWLVWAFFSLLFLAVGSACLAAAWNPFAGLSWLIPASGMSAYLLLVLRRGLEQNQRAGEQNLFPDLGWGNRLTLLRGILVAGLLGFVVLPRPPGWIAWVPSILYTLSDAADFFDGYLARITQRATRLGESLDMSFDGMGVLAAAWLGVQYGQLPGWYLSIGLARYLFLAGSWLRQRAGKPCYPLPPSVMRRVLAGFQMGFLAAILWPLLGPPATLLAAYFFGIPFLLGFLRDWLYLSGVLRPTRPAPAWLEGLLGRWLPLALRLLIIVLSAVRLLPMVHHFFSLPPLQAALLGLEILMAVLVGLGILGRVAAIVGLIALGLSQLFLELSPASILVAAAYTAIIFLGSGSLALWSPEEYLIHHRAGERRSPPTQPTSEQP
jgi:CDP-diacylglycerol--glycerol-3-phosphate 3-phosphatidyltransferase